MTTLWSVHADEALPPPGPQQAYIRRGARVSVESAR